MEFTQTVPEHFGDSSLALVRGTFESPNLVFQKIPLLLLTKLFELKHGLFSSLCLMISQFYPKAQILFVYLIWLPLSVSTLPSAVGSSSPTLMHLILTTEKEGWYFSSPFSRTNEKHSISGSLITAHVRIVGFVICPYKITT
jgi:hypothetical protein